MTMLVQFIKFVLNFLILTLYFVIIFINNLEDLLNLRFWRENIDLISGFATILGLFGLVLALVEYYNKEGTKNENQRQLKIRTLEAIIPLEKNLANATWWTNFDKGGYQKGDGDSLLIKWKKENYYQLVNPLFTTLNPLTFTILENADLFKDLNFKNKNIYDFIAGYIQWGVAFNNLLNKIERFIASRDAKDNVILTNKLSKSIDLNQEEKDFCDILYMMYQSLFFNIVGSYEDQHLYFYHKNLKKLLEEHKENISLL